VEIDANAADGSSATSGAIVAGVVSDSPASEAGIAAGSVITSLDGQVVDSADELTHALELSHPGSTVTINWTTSSGQSESEAVVLSSGPAA
jgi:S1-C subfamily serine protease